MRGVAVFAALALAVLGFADQAIVVGINHYRSLPPDRQLEGPENDAADVAAFCRAKGYELPASRYLLGKNATGAAIRAAWAEVQRNIKPDEKVLFFFAGHGTKSGPATKPICSILPYDFSAARPESLINVNELYGAIKAITTKGNRTVILDSCFSGGMARDLDGFRSRSIGGIDRSVLPMLDDTQAHVGVPPASPAVVDPDKICYLTAARASEEALETEVDGKAHGLFTHFLLPELQKEKVTCGQAKAGVQASIAKFLKAKATFRKQTPDVTDEYRNLLALAGTPNPGKPLPDPPTPKSVWDMIARERPDKDAVQLSVESLRGAPQVGQSLRFKAHVGKPGYLVVLWSKDTVSVQLPLRGPTETRLIARYTPQGDYSLAPEGAQAFDQAGGNRVTAFLFTSPKPAQRLLDAFNAAPAREGAAKASVEELQQGRGLVNLGGTGEGDCFTSGLSFEVGAQIIGGYEVVDAPALCDALLHEGGLFEEAFLNGVEACSLQRLRAERSRITDPRRFSSDLTMCVNMTIDSLVDGGPYTWAKPDAGSAGTQQAIRDTMKKLRTATPDEAVVLHAELLAKLLPKYVKPVDEVATLRKTNSAAAGGGR